MISKNSAIFLVFIFIIVFFEYVNYFEYRSWIVELELFKESDFIENFDKNNLKLDKNRKVFELEESKTLTSKDFLLGFSYKESKMNIKYNQGKIYSYKDNYLFVKNISPSLFKLRKSMIIKSFEAMIFFVLFLMFFNVNYKKNILQIDLEHSKEIEKDLLKAKTMQQKVFKEKEISDESIILKSFYKPYREIGGDFFDVSKIDEDNYLIYIGDFSGHGVSAAMISFFVKISMETIKSDIFNLEKVCKRLNNLFIDIKGLEDYYLTFFIGILNTKTKKIEFISSGHSLPIKIANKNIDFAFQESENSFILGMIKNIRFYKHEITFKENDEFLFYTDGLIENLGLDNVKDNLQEGESKLREEVSKAEQKDDATYIYLKIKQNKEKMNEIV